MYYLCTVLSIYIHAAECRPSALDKEFSRSKRASFTNRDLSAATTHSRLRPLSSRHAYRGKYVYGIYYIMQYMGDTFHGVIVCILLLLCFRTLSLIRLTVF